MADRAARTEDAGREVFDLEKDDRWQARLAEARVRRAIALRDKANSEAPPKPRPKPWEADGQDDLPDFEELEALLAPEPSDRPDFADRVKSMRKAVEADAADATRPGDNGGPALDMADARRRSLRDSLSLVETEPEPMADHGPEDTPAEAAGSDRPKLGTVSVADRYIRALSPDFTPVRPFVPETHGHTVHTPGFVRETLSADETEKLARDYASTMKSEPVAPAPPATKARRRGVPALLLAGVCILAILPFTKSMPPLEMGPMGRIQVPGFGLPPALGTTSPMNEVPARTVSGEWTPLSKEPPRGPLALPLEPAARLHQEAAGLPVVDAGDGAFGVLGWSVVAAGVSSRETPRLGHAAADGLPGEAMAAPAVTDEDRADAAPRYPAPLSLLTVTVMVPETNTSALADEIVADLGLRGHGIGAVRSVNLKITERNIRFFHERDRGETARLAEAYGARLRDFTNFRPSPSAGTVEIWLAGEALPRKLAAPRAPRAEAQQIAPVPRIVIVQRQPSLIERLTGGLVIGHVDDGLPNPAPGDGTEVEQADSASSESGSSPDETEAGTDVTVTDPDGTVTDPDDTVTGTDDTLPDTSGTVTDTGDTVTDPSGTGQ